METLAFLKRVLPSSGIYFIDVPYPTGHGFKHHTCESVERVAQLALQYDSQGATVYFACASFQQEFIEKMDPVKNEPKRVQRVQDNVKYVRSFWLDLDVDPTNERKFASQEAALGQLGVFCKATGLPIPLLVSSGYGIHCYWPMERDILPGEWKETAVAFKALTAALDFGQGDTSRTADMASVLRPPGTHNRKAKGGVATAVPVKVLHEGEVMDFARFASLVTAACTKHKAQVPKAKAPKVDPNAAFALSSTFPDSHAEQVAAKCQQIRLFRDEPNSLDEPTWYAGIQLLYYTVESEDVVHKWSSGHASYSPEETQRKIVQIQAFGPTTCATFESRRPDACKGCKFAGKIVSPIQLGTVVESAPPPALPPDLVQPDVEICNPRAPFTRGAKGGLFVDVEGVPIKFYDYDLYLVGLNAEDGHETATVRHHLPHEGWLQFSLPTYLVEDVKQCLMHLRKNFVKPPDGNKMVAYLKTYLQEVQARSAMRKSFTSLGWKNDFSQFALGNRLYKDDGTVLEAGLVNRVVGTLSGFTGKGDLATWAAATQPLGRPGAEAHAFSLLLGFGAPLLKLTGFDGLTFAMLGQTGVGKTLMAHFALSIYGVFKDLCIEFKSTFNARMERIAAYNNLPAYVDEMTNLPAEEVSQLMYDVNGGKGRERLNRDGMSKGRGEWSTFLITSANSSFAQKLVGAKADAEAELMRLFEYEVPRLDAEFVQYMKYLATEMLPNNYGLAGPTYIQYVVTHAGEVKQAIEAVKRHLEQEVESDGRDRFWIAGAACCLVGGMIAQQLGLIRFEIQPLMAWVCRQIKAGLWQADEGKMNAVSFIGEFLDDTAGTRLVLNGTNLGLGVDAGAVIKLPGTGSALHSRFELDARVAFVSRKTIHEYANKRKVGFLQLRRDLTEKRVLIHHDVRKVLGAGTNLSGAQVPCWKLDLSHPAFADMVAALEKEPPILPPKEGA